VTALPKRIDHVSMAVWKIDDQLPFFTEVFGWKEAGRFSNPEAGFAGVVLDVPGADGQRQMQWEILEPLGDDSFIAKFLRERGPGLHHVTLEVDDADGAARTLRKHGIEPFEARASWDWKEMFVAPKASGRRALPASTSSSTRPATWVGRRRLDDRGGRIGWICGRRSVGVQC
jgi:methylmalonyl-CoA/ethylmalonyl-CoA epimerase